MASFPGKLTPLQRELLEAFFVREHEFYLTGGAALAGFYLGHRATLDLDLFTQSAEAFERGRFVLGAAAQSLGATCEARQAAPGFHRYLVQRGAETLVVDLVLETVPQLVPEKPWQDGLRLDPPLEILANKLASLVERAELRVVVDLLLLERAGFRVEDALAAAEAKDAACTPATLAWVLSEIRLGEATEIPADLAVAEVRGFIADLSARLRRAAFPSPE